MANRNNKNQNGNNRFTNRFNKKFNGKSQKVDYKEIEKNSQMAKEFFKADEDSIKNCPYCDEPVKFMNSAVFVAGFDDPIHFDCVIDKIKKDENMQPDETVNYLGKGSFGIIKKIEKSPGFEIRKRIQIEPEHEKVQWRKEIGSRIKKFEDNK